MPNMKKFLIGIDAGATNIKAGLIDPTSYKVIFRTLLSTGHYKPKKEKLIEAFSKAVDLILRKNNLSKKDILAVGLGLPGPIDSQKGIVYFLPNIPGWKNIPIKRILERKLRIPVFVDNDVNLITLAEWRLGAARGAKNLLCITLGTGVGGGLILDNKLYRGAHFLAGEIGHSPINEFGPTCNCGGQAHLERYVGNKYILASARNVFKNKDLTLEKISLLAKKGNRAAINIWQDVGRRVGIALCSAVNLLNLEIIVIGGGVSSAGKPLFESIKKTILKSAMPILGRQVRIVKSSLSSDAGILGAAILAKEKI